METIEDRSGYIAVIPLSVVTVQLAMQCCGMSTNWTSEICLGFATLTAGKYISCIHVL